MDRPAKPACHGQTLAFCRNNRGRCRFHAGALYGVQEKTKATTHLRPAAAPGAAPNRAAIVYANLARQAFPGLPLVLGGIEASLRRITHYDFWSDSLRRPLLADAKADILVYGMGERPLLELALLAQNSNDAFLSKARFVRGVATIGRRADLPDDEAVVRLPGLRPLKLSLNYWSRPPCSWKN